MYILTFHKHVSFPVVIWTAVLAYAFIYRLFTGRPYKTIFKMAFFMGLVLSIYPYLIGLESLIQKGLPVARVYMLYVQMVMTAANMVMAIWSARLINVNVLDVKARTRAVFEDAFFLPVAVAPFFAVYVYSYTGNIANSLGLIAAYMLLILSFNKYGFSGFLEKVPEYFNLVMRSPYLPALLFLASFALRVFFLNHLINEIGISNYISASDDGDAYERMALEGMKDMSYFARETPGNYLMFYSAFLALAYKVLGHSFYIAGYLQSLLASAMVLAVYFIAQTVFKDRTISFLSAAMLAIDQPMVHLTTTLNTEALYIPFLTFAILFLVMYRASGFTKMPLVWLSLGGIFLGLAVIIREVIVLMPLFLFPWILIWGKPYQKGRFARRIRDFALMLACMAMLILPITVKNYINTGRFHLVYRSGGASWSLSSNWGEDNDPSNERLIALGIDPFTDIAGSVCNIIRKPVDFCNELLRLIPLRMRNLFLWPKFGYFDPVYMFNPFRIVSEYGAIMIFYYIMLLFTSAVIFIFSRAEAALRLLVGIPVIYYCIFHGVFFLCRTTRYAAPMTPFLCIILAYGLVCIFRALWDVKA
jgi:hypothetical protein